MIQLQPKTPWEQLTYGLSLSQWLNGATLSSASWAIVSGAPSLSIMTDAIDAINGIAYVKLAGGTMGATCELRCRFTASDGERGQRDCALRIVEKKPQKTQ